MDHDLPEPGSRTPDFVAEGTFGTFSSSVWSTHELRVLLFFPLAFTPVCSEELAAVDREITRFQERSAEIIAISVDSLPSLRAFAASLGIGELPLLSDQDQEIARAFGVLRDEGIAQRATFVIDRKGTIRLARLHDLMVRREVSSILELLDEARSPGGDAGST